MGTNNERMSARERIEYLVDAGSFVETEKYLERSNAVLGYADTTAPGEGVIAGWGSVDGRPVALFAQDTAALKGSLGAAHAAKICRVIDMAVKTGMPVIGIWDSEGARLQEGALALDAYASIIKKLTDVSGVIPTISVAAGKMLGSAALIAPVTDFTIAVENEAAIGLYGAMILASAEGKDVDREALTGAHVAEEAGAAQFVVENDGKALDTLKMLLSYLPQNNLEGAPMAEEPGVVAAVTADASDIRATLEQLSDDGVFFEVQPGFADSMITGFVSVDGVTAGVVATVPGEEIAPKGCLKAARFISILDSFDIPVLTFVNSEGAAASIELTACCQTRAFAKLASAYATASCPKITVITGKAVGAGYTVMCPKSLGADVVYAYETAEISCLEAEAGSIAMYDGKADKADEYKEKFASALAAARQGIVDDIIAPADLGAAVTRALGLSLSKREHKYPKKHGNMPL